MKNFISAAGCGAIVAAATISLMAQTTTPQGATASTSNAQRVTVTGCLKPAAPSSDTSSAAGTTGTSGTAAPNATDAANAKFVLADAAVTPSTDTTAPNAAAGAPSTTTTSKDSTQTYRLIANPTALAPHVGKKLELTGTIVDEASNGSNDQAPSGSGPILRVEAGKILAAACQN